VGQFQLQTGERRPPATPAPAARQVAHRIDRSDIRISAAAGAAFFGAIRVDPRNRPLVRSNGPTPGEHSDAKPAGVVTTARRASASLRPLR